VRSDDDSGKYLLSIGTVELNTADPRGVIHFISHRTRFGSWFPPHANVSCLPYILGPREWYGDCS
jgi:hypothetical protein